MRLRSLTSLMLVCLVAWSAPKIAAQEKSAPGALLPSGTQAVIVVNVKQMLDCPLVKKDLPKLQAQIKANAEAQKHLTALGFDPLKDLDSVTIGAAGVEDQDQVLIVARGRFDAAKFKAAAENLAKEKKESLKVLQVGGQTIYEAHMDGQPKPLFVAQLDGNTIVAGMKQSDVADAFDIKAGKKKVEAKKELQDLLRNANMNQSVTVLILGGALGNGVPFGDKVQHINGGVNLGDDIKTSFLITTKDAESAKGLAELLQQGLEQGKQFVALFAQQQKELAPLADIIDVLKVDTKDNTVSIKGEVSKEAVEKLNKK